jgi:hypothetical protein
LALLGVVVGRYEFDEAGHARVSHGVITRVPAGRLCVRRPWWPASPRRRRAGYSGGQAVRG